MRFMESSVSIAKVENPLNSFKSCNPLTQKGIVVIKNFQVEKDNNNNHHHIKKKNLLRFQIFNLIIASLSLTTTTLYNLFRDHNIYS